MNTRALKLVALFVLLAAVASALTVSYLLARPGGAPSGSVTGVVRLAGGAMTLAGCGKRARRTDVVGGASSSPTISVIS